MRLAYLTPGLTPVNTDPGASNTSFPTNFVSNGVRSSTSDVYVDGAVVTGLEASGSGSTFLNMQPNLETVQEFKVQTNFFGAEFGNTGGTVVNVLSKSGTNELHGALFEYHRRDDFNANSFFAKRSGSASLPDFTQNKFGGAIGGPVHLPKLYNGKNRTFFHASAELDFQQNGATQLSTVPTALERAGDFSDTRDASGRLFTVFNPFDTYQSGATVLRRPFPNNTVPMSMQNPIARKVMEYYPQPTSEGRPFTHAQNFFAQGTSGGNTYRGNGKIDHVFDSRQRLFSRYAREAFRQKPLIAWGGPAEPYTTGRFNSDTHNFVIDYTRAHNPTTVMSVRYGVVRQIVDHLPHSLGFDPTSLGLPPIVLTSGIPLFPRFQPEGYNSVGTASNSQRFRGEDTHSLIYSITRIAGAHTVKAGGESRLYRMNWAFLNTPSGQFTFGRITTSENPLVSNAIQGNGLASFLLGWGNGGRYSLDERPASSSQFHGWYVQDDWKITRRLTLNLGLRYDFELPRTERYNRYSWFDFDIPSPIAGQVPGYDLRGGLQFTSDQMRSPFDADMNNVQPRFGFAYALNERTSVRGGYGMYYSLSKANANRGLGAPFSVENSIQWSRDGGITQYATLSNPWPDGLILPAGKSAGTATFLGQNLSTTSRANRNPQYQQWAFSVQRQLPSDSVLEVNYTGTKGTHLYFPDLENINRLHPIYWSIGRTELNRLVPNPFFGVITDPTSRLSAATVTRTTLLRPFPQYTALGVTTPTRSNSIYHSGQLKFEKRFSAGLAAQASYTWAKLIDDASNSGYDTLGGDSGVQNLWNLTLERSVSVMDIAHRAVVSFSYELPFGRNKAIGSGWSRPLDLLAGGWVASGLLTFQTGYPIVIGMGSPNLLEGRQRPNLIGDPSKPGSVRDRLDAYFNTAAFSTPAADTYGSAPRTLNYRGPGIANADLVLGKQFRVYEGQTLEFRLEAFNALNGVAFGMPNAAFGGTTFGQINNYAGGLGARQIQFAVRYDF